LSLPPSDPLLHEEVVGLFKRIIQAQTSIGVSVGLGLTASVIRSSAKGTISVTGSATPQYITPDTLITLDTSKSFWESALGSAVLQIVAMFFILFWQEHSLDIRDAKAGKKS
jgi:hypothetical protein